MGHFQGYFRFSGYFDLWRLSPKNNPKRFLRLRVPNNRVAQEPEPETGTRDCHNCFKKNARNRTQKRNRRKREPKPKPSFSVTVLQHRTPSYPEEPAEPKTGTAEAFHPQTATEPNRGHPAIISQFLYISLHLSKPLCPSHVLPFLFLFFVPCFF